MTDLGPRLRAIVELCPTDRPLVDVGADHGRVALATGGIATERFPHRRSRAPVRWVVADGLRPFRHVAVAVIGGMGARTIARVLSDVPKPGCVVLHAQDDPPVLRRWLAANGWRLDAERLAPEGAGFAEIVRAVPGRETSSGLDLDFGPRLLASDDPWLRPHLAREARRWSAIAEAAGPRRPDARERASFLLAVLRSRGWGVDAL